MPFFLSLLFPIKFLNFQDFVFFLICRKYIKYDLVSVKLRPVLGEWSKYLNKQAGGWGKGVKRFSTVPENYVYTVYSIVTSKKKEKKI